MKSNTWFNKRGSASVIVIMVMLLLVIFGVLAFVSAGSSLKLAQKNAQTVKDYYLLDKQGEVAVAQISALLQEGPLGPDPGDQIRKRTGITDITVVPGPSENPAFIIRIHNPALTNGASLKIRLHPAMGVQGGAALEIREWKLIYKPFDYTGTVNLWDGGN